jgi:hypothetical protein
VANRVRGGVGGPRENAEDWKSRPDAMLTRLAEYCQSTTIEEEEERHVGTPKRANLQVGEEVNEHDDPSKVSNSLTSSSELNPHANWFICHACVRQLDARLEEGEPRNNSATTQGKCITNAFQPHERMTHAELQRV